MLIINKQKRNISIELEIMKCKQKKILELKVKYLKSGKSLIILIAHSICQKRIVNLKEKTECYKLTDMKTEKEK